MTKLKSTNLFGKHACKALLSLVFLGCNSMERPHAIHEMEIKPSLGGGNMPKDQIHGFSGGNSGMPSMGMPADNPAPLHFEAPKGWAYEPGTGMRAATFKITDQGKVNEATIVILPDAKEGYAANVRRWLGQLTITLPENRLTAFVGERENFSTVQNASGALFDFTRLQAEMPNAKNFMLAAIIEMDGRAVFVKLTGDKEFLAKSKNDFLALSKSIDLNAEDSPMDAGTPELSGGMNMPSQMTMQSQDPAFNQVAQGVSHLTWKTPSGWKSLAPSGMRTGSFEVTLDGKKADGSIIQLPGSAGGIESNVRRWMEQVGMTQLDDDGLRSFLASQRKIKTKDGDEGLLINLAAQLSGNIMEENSILAVIINTSSEVIFVKLTGPRSVLIPNVDALAQLSSSLATAH